MDRANELPCSVRNCQGLSKNEGRVVFQVRRAHEDMRKRRLDDFMAGFNVISLKLKEMYQMITLGGDAELELVDSLDPFAEVRPLRSSPQLWSHSETVKPQHSLPSWRFLV